MRFIYLHLRPLYKKANVLIVMTSDNGARGNLFNVGIVKHKGRPYSRLLIVNQVWWLPRQCKTLVSCLFFCYYNKGRSTFHTLPATILAPAAVGCMPSFWFNSATPPTPCKRKGTRLILFFAAICGNIALKPEA